MKEGTIVICNKAGSKECPDSACYCNKPHDYAEVWCNDCGCGQGPKAPGSKCIPTNKKVPHDPKEENLRIIRLEAYKESKSKKHIDNK